MTGDDVIPDAGKFSSFSSQPQNRIHLKEWSMVVIRDSPAQGDCSIFPPLNHENLHVSSHQYQEQQNPPSPSSSSSSSLSSPSSSCTLSPSLSPSDSLESDLLSDPPSDSGVKRAGEVTSWISVGLEVLRYRVFAVVSSFRNYGAKRRGAFWALGPIAAAAVAVLGWTLFIRARWRRRRRTESVSRLMEIIKEKDEKITQLLHQIAQMNEVLVARHRDLTSKLA